LLIGVQLLGGDISQAFGLYFRGVQVSGGRLSLYLQVLPVRLNHLQLLTNIRDRSGRVLAHLNSLLAQRRALLVQLPGLDDLRIPIRLNADVHDGIVQLQNGLAQANLVLERLQQGLAQFESFLQL